MLWAAALLLSMPMLIAGFRKLQAMGMLIAEIAVQKMELISARSAVAGLITSSTTIAGVVIGGALLLVLSAAILPTWKILIVLVAVVAIITALLWRVFVRLHSKAQISLRQTLDQPTMVMERPGSPLRGLMDKAELLTVTVAPGSRGHGRLIRELQLRTHTGATIVGLERSGETTVNPGPDEELKAGDQVLLLGRRRQLDKARDFLSANGSPETAG
jgi:monovalent cation:H+ antiporter-2, CPA2 family